MWTMLFDSRDEDMFSDWLGEDAKDWTRDVSAPVCGNIAVTPSSGGLPVKLRCFVGFGCV